MKCSKCGKEIANDSNFCEYCGAKVHKRMSRNNFYGLLTLIFSLIIIVGVIGFMIMIDSMEGNRVYDAAVEEVAMDTVVVVDLGLPSGTLWFTTNENDLYDYDTAQSEYGKNLPTKEQWEELKEQCQWTWTGSGYKVTGPNGFSISLPAAGFRQCDGDVVGSDGSYWSSSTTNGVEGAWCLNFNSLGVGMGYAYSCNGLSVRLVQD